VVQRGNRSDPDGPVSRRQATRAPLTLDEGDLLWKCWVTNVHRGVHVQVLSAKRADSTYSAAIIFIREGKDGKPTARFWVKHRQNEEDIVELANELMTAVADDHLHFRLIDLSDVRKVEDQIAALHEEGFSVLGIYKTGRRPEEN
jgi:hypothetical protein